MNKGFKKEKKGCYVPHCGNTNTKTPGKKFVYVPRSIKTREQWYAVAHRERPVATGPQWCCEDHFETVSYALCVFALLYFSHVSSLNVIISYRHVLALGVFVFVCDLWLRMIRYCTSEHCTP